MKSSRYLLLSPALALAVKPAPSLTLAVVA